MNTINDICLMIRFLFIHALLKAQHYLISAESGISINTHTMACIFTTARLINQFIGRFLNWNTPVPVADPEILGRGGPIPFFVDPR